MFDFISSFSTKVLPLVFDVMHLVGALFASILCFIDEVIHSGS